jgi:hypothetical protein
MRWECLAGYFFVYNSKTSLKCRFRRGRSFVRRRGTKSVLFTRIATDFFRRTLRARRGATQPVKSTRQQLTHQAEEQENGRILRAAVDPTGSGRRADEVFHADNGE